MPRLTPISIENWRPRAQRYAVPDSGCRGLYLNVYPTGRKSWSVRYRFGGVTRNLTLDGFPSLAQARMAATKALAEVAQGKDPAAAKQEVRRTDRAHASDTVEHWAGLFVERYAKKHTRPNSWRQTVHVVDDYVLPAWRGRLIRDIKRKDVRALLEGIAEGKPIMANRAHGVLSKFFKWVCARDDELTSPVIGVERPAPERARERMLDDDEIVRLWKALDAIGGPTAAALQVLVLTGQRKHEIALLEWDEIGLGVMDAGINVLDLPAARMKGRQAHMLPMSTQAAEIIDAQPRVNDLVFAYKRPHFERLKREIDARMGDVSKWVIHDVRRSVASGMARIGIALPVIEKVLAHRKGSFAGVAGTYQRHTFLPEMASALQRWGDHVEGLVSGRKLTKVVRLHKPQ